jgi:hypothetical protein
MIEKPEQEKRYMTLDGEKNLTLKQVSDDFYNFLLGNNELELSRNDAKLLNTNARMFLIKKGYLAPGEQPAGISQEIFNNLVEHIKNMNPTISAISSEKPVSVFSRKEQRDMLRDAHKLKENEENRAGQTYQESGLEQ